MLRTIHALSIRRRPCPCLTPFLASRRLVNVLAFACPVLNQVERSESERMRMEMESRDSGEQLREMAEKVFQLLERLKLAELAKNKAMEVVFNDGKQPDSFPLRCLLLVVLKFLSPSFCRRVSFSLQKMGCDVLFRWAFWVSRPHRVYYTAPCPEFSLS